MTQDTRVQLAKVYDAKAPDMPAQKTAVMQQFRDRYAALCKEWADEGIKPAQLTNLDRWVLEANNASFGAQGAYDDLVPAFVALFEREQKNWPRFHEAVKQLAALPREERHAALAALVPPQPAMAIPAAQR